MSNDISPRRVRLLIISARHTASELADRLQMESDAGLHTDMPSEGRPAESTWELHESGQSDADISSLIDSIYSRALPVTDGIKRLRDEGCQVILRIILELSPDDEHGAGFVITAPLIEWLSQIGIEFVDVAQYVFE